MNQYLGPSIYLLILDLFLENPDNVFNLTEISKRLDKNPGSVHPVLPKLVERRLIKTQKLGKKTILYSLNKDNEFIKAFYKIMNELRK
ncbi:MAG: helix-turn-helix domain-containing protein [Candidatus Odinarchaeia archaeon]